MEPVDTDKKGDSAKGAVRIARQNTDFSNVFVSQAGDLANHNAGCQNVKTSDTVYDAEIIDTDVSDGIEPPGVVATPVPRTAPPVPDWISKVGRVAGMAAGVISMATRLLNRFGVSKPGNCRPGRCRRKGRRGRRSNRPW